MAEIRASTTVTMASLGPAVHESPVFLMQALLTALLSSSLELAPHHAEPEQGE